MNKDLETINNTVETGVKNADKIDEFLYNVAFGLIEVVLILFAVFITTKILMAINHRLMRKQATKISDTRATTIASILDDLIKYFMSFLGVIFVLPVIGIDSNIILASSGFLAIIIGVGGSSFIGDFIDGFFALFEGYYDVGDYIKVGGFEGEIIDIGLKTTVLKTFNNEVVSVPNSAIIEVINLSKLPYIQYGLLSTSYSAKLVDIEQILEDELVNIMNNKDIIQEFSYVGVDTLGPSSVDLKFEIISTEKDRFEALRQFNREAKIICDANKIEIPFTQVVIHQGE